MIPIAGGLATEVGAGTELRDVMRRYATGIAIITAPAHDGCFVGMTISSFVSISIEPNIVAVSLKSDSRTARAVREHSVFAVNILGRGQQELARTFSRPGGLRPGAGAHKTISGVPVGIGDLGFVLCEGFSSTSMSDHDVIFGRVTESRTMAGEPLVYFDRAFRVLAGETPARRPRTKPSGEPWLTGQQPASMAPRQS